MSLTDKFDRRRTAKSGQQGEDGENGIENYAKPGMIRYLSFVMLDGRREFFCYADLASCSFHPEENEITLLFRGVGSVRLKGQNMTLLYEQFQNQLPRQIICIDKRYTNLQSKNNIYIIEMIVEKS